MKITKEWLEEKDACMDGTDWFNAQEERDASTIMIKATECGHLDWGMWIFERLCTNDQAVISAIHSAELCIDSFESEYPDDDRSRKAIESAKNCLANPCEAGGAAAWAAADAADAAGAAAREAAREAAWAAAWAAWEAAWAAWEAAWAAWEAAWAAWAAA